MLKFTVQVLLKPGLENLSITLLASEMSAIVWESEHSLALPFFGIGPLGLDHRTFSSPVAIAEFSKFAGILNTALSPFRISPLRIWNSSNGIPSPPLALFVVMLPTAHLTWHSRMSGSRWGITPSWLSGSWRSFLCISSVYSCHLFLISSASVRAIPFLSFIVLIFAWNVSLVSLIFLKRSLVFPILFFPSISLITEEGFLFSPCYSLELWI